MTSTCDPSVEVLPSLRKHFGHQTFRPGQEQIVSAVLSGQDVLAVMPTGSGKSLGYQLPAVILPGTTLVVSPLISLMKDQVDGLRECGYPAAALYSGMPPHALRETEAEFAAGRYRLLFVAPERLLKAKVLMALYSVRSERLFCEMLEYNLLFRWFLDMDMMESAWDASTFSKNQERLKTHYVGAICGGASPNGELDFRRTLHCRRNIDRGVGESEEFSTKRRWHRRRRA